MSQDKLCVLQIMPEHFINIKSGYANGMMYTPPIILINGSSGRGKSWLTKTKAEIAELMDLDIHSKTAFMDIAVLNTKKWMKALEHLKSESLGYR